MSCSWGCYELCPLSPSMDCSRSALPGFYSMAPRFFREEVQVELKDLVGNVLYCTLCLGLGLIGLIDSFGEG